MSTGPVHMLVLANSAKKLPGRCLAGKRLTLASDGRTVLAGPWFRPVADGPEGALMPQHVRLPAGTDVQLLDRLEVPVTEHAGEPLQPENYRLDQRGDWRLVRRCRATPELLAALTDQPAGLWDDPLCRSDRVRPEFQSSQQSPCSLLLVEPSDLVFSRSVGEWPNGCRKRETRASFSYRGREYHLKVTDPAADRLLPGAWPDSGTLEVRLSAGTVVRLCLSLTLPWSPAPDGPAFQYKLVASVLVAERHP